VQEKLWKKWICANLAMDETPSFSMSSFGGAKHFCGLIERIQGFAGQKNWRWGFLIVRLLVELMFCRTKRWIGFDDLNHCGFLCFGEGEVDRPR
jgi:hypothetical protein